LGGFLVDSLDLQQSAVDEAMMGFACEEARLAITHGDVPVGAVVVCDGVVIARGHNQRECSGDPTAHAEVLALRDAAKHIGHWRLHGCTLYVTLEPCFMCAGALVNARIDRVVFGANDPKAGAVGSLANVLMDDRLNHSPLVTGGVLGEQCGQFLKDFFVARRKKPESFSTLP
jgi:tRNA(adenine34) deaminase